MEIISTDKGGSENEQQIFRLYRPGHNDHRGGELGAYRLLPFQSGNIFIRGYDLDLQDHLRSRRNLRSLSPQLIRQDFFFFRQ